MWFQVQYLLQVLVAGSSPVSVLCTKRIAHYYNLRHLCICVSENVAKSPKGQQCSCDAMNLGKLDIKMAFIKISSTRLPANLMNISSCEDVGEHWPRKN